MIIFHQICAITTPQADADSRIRCLVFVRQKSAEKIRLTEFAAEFYPAKIRGKIQIFE